MLCFGIAFLYLPILVLIAYSFNASPLVSVWGGFSTAWYGALLHNHQILDAARLSLEIAVRRLDRRHDPRHAGGDRAGAVSKRFPGRLLLTGMVNGPLIMPEIITGITQMLLFVSMTAMSVAGRRAAASRPSPLPISPSARLCHGHGAVAAQGRRPRARRAAMDLGAGPARAFIDITLPIIAPALASGWLLSFTVSVDDLVIPASSRAGRQHPADGDLLEGQLGVSPDINALASLIIARSARA